MRSGLLIQYTAKVRIPPSGGILRRAEIYQRPAADLEIRSNITPHSKFPYKKQEDSMSSCFFFSGVERANIRLWRNSRMSIAARDTISTDYTFCTNCKYHLLARQYTAFAVCETLLRRFRVGSLAGRSKFPYAGQKSCFSFFVGC